MKDSYIDIMIAYSKAEISVKSDTCKTLYLSGFFPLLDMLLNSRMNMQHVVLNEKRTTTLGRTSSMLLLAIPAGIFFLSFSYSYAISKNYFS